MTPTTANNQDDCRAHTTARIINEIHEHLWVKICSAQDRQANNADENRLPGPRSLHGHWVWLDAKNITTRYPSRKLDHHRLRPFEVLADDRLKTPYTMLLALSHSMLVHPVFHVSLLEHTADEPFPGQLADPPPPVVVHVEEEYHVDEILDSREETPVPGEMVLGWSPDVGRCRECGRPAGH